MKNVARCTALLLPLLFALNAGATTYVAVLNGLNESPPNASPGFGDATVIFDTSLHTLDITVNFSGLVGITTASHIHCCTAVAETGTAPVATQVPVFAGFPLGVGSGTYHNVWDTSLASTWNPSFITNHGGSTAAAEIAFATGLMGKLAYLNIHTNTFPGGEIRGFLTPVPEPSNWAMLLAGLVPVLLWRSRKT